MVTISNEERRQLLGWHHWLARPCRDSVGLAADLVGLHSTDPVTVYLSCRARIAGFVRQHLDGSLYEQRTLLRVLGMRRTVFVVPSGLAPVVAAGCSRRYVAAEQRRLLQVLADQHALGEDWLVDLKRRTLAAIAELGEPTGRELVAAVPGLDTKITFGEGKTWGGQVGVATRVLFLLGAEGAVVRGRPMGSWASTQYRWALRDRWVDADPAEVDPAEARAQLAGRWLRAYGPGTVADLKWWSGWGVGETRTALAAVNAVPVQLPNGTGFVLPEAESPQPVDDWAALLPSLDPTPMGWKERDWFLGPHQQALFDRSGNIGPSIWLNGRIVGGWAISSNGEIRLGLLEPVSGPQQARIDAEAHSLTDWLGGERFLPRFRTPLEKELCK